MTAVDLPGPLVTADWLAEHLSSPEPAVVVADVRWDMGQGPMSDAYLAGHLPGAVFVDLDADLSAPPGERGRHPLPTPEDFAAARARLGLGDKPVIAYDDRSGAVAARLWWMLTVLGHPAAVLDGGMQGWPGPLEAGSVAPTPSTTPIEATPWPSEHVVEVDDVLTVAERSGAWLDARSAERFAGQPNPIDARPGHIPNTQSWPWQNNLDESGRFRSPDELAEAYRHLGAEQGLVASCGSGVTGCHNLLAGVAAGLGLGRLYVGSWSEWMQNPDHPVIVDDDC